jgi:hypothetical protein
MCSPDGLEHCRGAQIRNQRFKPGRIIFVRVAGLALRLAQRASISRRRNLHILFLNRDIFIS